MTSPFPDNKAETMAAINDPQVGDLFHEQYSFYLYVVARDGDMVTTMEASPPCTFPDDGKVHVQTVSAFIQRVSYESIPGSWVRLRSRGNAVEGWLKDEQTESEADHDDREPHQLERGAADEHDSGAPDHGRDQRLL